MSGAHWMHIQLVAKPDLERAEHLCFMKTRRARDKGVLSPISVMLGEGRNPNNTRRLPRLDSKTENGSEMGSPFMLDKFPTEGYLNAMQKYAQDREAARSAEDREAAIKSLRDHIGGLGKMTTLAAAFSGCGDCGWRAWLNDHIGCGFQWMRRLRLSVDRKGLSLRPSGFCWGLRAGSWGLRPAFSGCSGRLRLSVEAAKGGTMALVHLS